MMPTPGPWTVDLATWPPLINGESYTVATAEHHDAIAAERAEANARLIAKAPEMAAKLRQIRTDYMPFGDTAGIDALLAEIEGEVKP